MLQRNQCDMKLDSQTEFATACFGGSGIAGTMKKAQHIVRLQINSWFVSHIFIMLLSLFLNGIIYQLLDHMQIGSWKKL